MQGTGAPRKHRARIPFVFAAPVLLACVGTVQIVAGEVIPVSGGLGWDGRFYANVAADLPRAVSGGEIDVYHVRRIVPSAMVWFALHALGRPLDAEHARETFAWLNLAFQLLTLAAWTAAARRTGLDDRTRTRIGPHVARPPPFAVRPAPRTAGMWAPLAAARVAAARNAPAAPSMRADTASPARE